MVNQWCEGNDKYLIVSYTPDLSTDKKFIEFYSSNVDFFTSNLHVLNKPQLDFNYNVIDDVITVSQYFTFTNASSELNNASIHVVDNDTLLDFGYIYLLNPENETDTFVDSMLDVNELTFNDLPIISADELNTNIEIATIRIKLNDEIIDSISSFKFSLNTIKAYSTNNDITGDNFSDDNADGTENNNSFDEGEPYFDYGKDQCPDEFEDGNAGCLVAIDEFESTDILCKITAEGEVAHESCIYNSTGTENNSLLNWEDVDGDGRWDAGEGEEWKDLGNDGCDDKFEDGDGGCLDSENPEYSLGTDPNNDNKNIDPQGDDFDEILNPDGTEGNRNWDEGESYIDCGEDGILNSEILVRMMENSMITSVVY